jgi:hypothetical protein
MKRKFLLLMLIPVSLIIAAQGQPQRKPETAVPDRMTDPKKYFPLKLGNEWHYELEIPKETYFPYDPYFIEPNGLLGTSVTNGSIKRTAVTQKFSMKITEVISDSEAKVEIAEEGRKLLWFVNDIKEARLAIVPQEKGVSIEVRGFMVKPAGWILGHALAQFSGNEAPSAPVRIAAGTFSKVIQSTIPHARSNYTPAYTQETWFAQDVGLIKAIALDADKNVIYKLELNSYQVK